MRAAPPKVITAPSIAACLDHADRTLAGPPRKVWIERVPGVGEMLARFVVQPLDLCKTTNQLERLPRWQKGKVAREIEEYIAPQLVHLRSGRLPLLGRPMIRAIRFSSREPDRTTDWSKIPIDVLSVRNARQRARQRATSGRRAQGLGIIVDDRPACLDLRTWWEYAPAGRAFGYFEIWTGC